MLCKSKVTFRLWYLLLYFSGVGYSHVQIMSLDTTSVTSITWTLAPFSLLSFKEMVLGKLHICTTSWRLLPRLCILETLSALNCLGPSRLVILVTQHVTALFEVPYSILTGDPIGLTPSIAKKLCWSSIRSKALNLLLKLYKYYS